VDTKAVYLALVREMIFRIGQWLKCQRKLARSLVFNTCRARFIAEAFLVKYLLFSLKTE
jgi:hypothetical protein